MEDLAPLKPPENVLSGQRNFLCSFHASKLDDTYCPQVVNGIECCGHLITDVHLCLWSDRSPISRELVDALAVGKPSVQLVRMSSQFPLDPIPNKAFRATDACSVELLWNRRRLTHPFLVVPNLPHAICIGSELLVRLGVQVDTINNVLWASTQPQNILLDERKLKGGQTIPEVCRVITSRQTTVPANTRNAIIHLHVLPGQGLDHTQAFFQPSPLLAILGLTLDAMPLVSLASENTTIAPPSPYGSKGDFN